jgi:hypothetical protein
VVFSPDYRNYHGRFPGRPHSLLQHRPDRVG